MEVVMNGKITKIQIFSLFIGFVGFSVVVEGALPPFIGNNQTKEELATTENELIFATKLHSEYRKNFRVESEKTGDYAKASKKPISGHWKTWDCWMICKNWKLILESFSSIVTQGTCKFSR